MPEKKQQIVIFGEETEFKKKSMEILVVLIV